MKALVYYGPRDVRVKAILRPAGAAKSAKRSTVGKKTARPQVSPAH